MIEYACYACNGLMEQAFGGPVEQLATWLNANTPPGIHLNVVGGADPRPPVQQTIFDSVVTEIKAKKTLIFIGHSLGAGLCYYLADYLNSKSLSAPLVVAIDPTQWGSNLPPDAPWALTPSHPGQWKAPLNIGTFINLHQPIYPGGGICVGGGQDIAVPGVDHISIPNCNLVRQTILHAIGKLL